jgi:hypothetical protein
MKITSLAEISNTLLKQCAHAVFSLQKKKRQATFTT